MHHAGIHPTRKRIYPRTYPWTNGQDYHGGWKKCNQTHHIPFLALWYAAGQTGIPRTRNTLWLPIRQTRKPDQIHNWVERRSRKHLRILGVRHLWKKNQTHFRNRHDRTVCLWHARKALNPYRQPWKHHDIQLRWIRKGENCEPSGRDKRDNRIWMDTG